jgi:glutathione S-transferase
MRLYDNAFSPYAFKVRACLYEKGIAFEHRELRVSSDHGALKRVNPRGEVPALEDGDAGLYDSKVICEYLEERFPAPALLPADPARRARVRQIELIADMQLDPLFFLLSLLVLRPSLQSRVPEALPRAAETARAHYANLERELAGRDYLVGDFSRADVACYPHLMSAAFLGQEIGADHPALRAWLERMTGRPAIRRARREYAAAFRDFQGAADPFFSRERMHVRDARVEWAIRFGLGPWLLEEIGAGRAFFSPVP